MINAVCSARDLKSVSIQVLVHSRTVGGRLLEGESQSKSTVNTSQVNCFCSCVVLFSCYLPVHHEGSNSFVGTKLPDPIKYNIKFEYEYLGKV